MMELTEVFGFILALLMVACSIKELHWSWPLAIASSGLYFFVFKNSLLYGEAALQLVFAALALWGWWQWLHIGSDHRPLVIQRLSRRGWVLLVSVSVALWPALAMALTLFTDSDVAWWDALPTALSLLAQILLGRKFIENWLVWCVVNVISVGLFAYKGLWLTSVLYVIFTLMSVWGWRSWRARLLRVGP